MSAEFDRMAAQYDELLKDPVRDYFAPESGFFVTRKIEVLLASAARLGLDTTRATWLDVGCGRGGLLREGRCHFARAVGCDVSTGMMKDAHDLELVQQIEPDRLPFDNESMDLVTAVCTYHHVEPRLWLGLTKDIRRVLKPGGIFALIEHNPLNLAVQIVVRRTPVDEHAVLLTAGKGRQMLRDAGLQAVRTSYFLYVPQRLYQRAKWLERAFEGVPLGGQYIVLGVK